MFYIKLSERKRRLGVLRQSLAFLGDVSPWLQIPVRFCRLCGVCFVCPVLGFYMVFCRCAIAGSRNEYVFLPDVGAVSQWLMAKTYCGLTAFRCCKNSQNIPKVVFLRKKICGSGPYTCPKYSLHREIKPQRFIKREQGLSLLRLCRA